jgi:hypothetical protein
LADEALGGDSEQLLHEASELLRVIQKYVALLQKQKPTSDSQEMADTQQLASLLQDMVNTRQLKRILSQPSFYCLIVPGFSFDSCFRV